MGQIWASEDPDASGEEGGKKFKREVPYSTPGLLFPDKKDNDIVIVFLDTLPLASCLRIVSRVIFLRMTLGYFIFYIYALFYDIMIFLMIF